MASASVSELRRQAATGLVPVADDVAEVDKRCGDRNVLGRRPGDEPVFPVIFGEGCAGKGQVVRLETAFGTEGQILAQQPGDR